MICGARRTLPASTTQPSVSAPPEGKQHRLPPHLALLPHGPRAPRGVVLEGEDLPPELTPALADDFIESEKAAGGSPATVQLRVAAASSFWTWLETPACRDAEPLPRDTLTARKEAAANTGGALGCGGEAPGGRGRARARGGHRHDGPGGPACRALPGLSITGDRWSSTTKGKEQSGKVPEEAREAITRAGLPLRSPFAGLSAAAIADRFRRLAIKLHGAGKLQARYSVHDLRHAFAVRLYEATHDVYQVEKALGHATWRSRRPICGPWGWGGARDTAGGEIFRLRPATEHVSRPSKRKPSKTLKTGRRATFPPWRSGFMMGLPLVRGAVRRSRPGGHVREGSDCGELFQRRGRR